MNRQMNLPALQRIAMEFEKENDIMDQRQEMMDDAIDDATGMEDEEESEDVVNQVLDEIGIDLGQAVRMACTSSRHVLISYRWVKHPVACKRLPCPRAEWRKLLEARILTTMTFRPVWTA
jgi:division protein CdvB (Snf7/Vps24/ESCRT-III family)